MRVLLTIFVNDVRQRFRDRSLIVFGLLVPLAIIALFSVLFSGIDDGPDLDPVTVAVAAPADDPMARQAVEVLRSLDVLEVTVDEVGADQIRQLARNGDASVGVTFPEGFTAAVSAGQAAEVPVILADQDGLEARIVVTVVDEVVGRMRAAAVAATAAAMGGVEPDRLEAIGRQVGESAQRIAVVEGEADDEQLSLQASLVAGQAGMFLLFTVGFGVLALVFEREQGTLARLLSLPLRPNAVVIAKAASGFLLGTLTTSVLLVAGSFAFDVSYGALVPVAVVVLGAVASSTSLIFVVARVAATSEQAVVAQTVLAMALGITGGAFFQIRATGWVGEVLEINPVSALSRGLGITSGGGGLADLGAQMAVFAGFTAVAAALAWVLPDRTGTR